MSQHILSMKRNEEPDLDSVTPERDPSAAERPNRSKALTDALEASVSRRPLKPSADEIDEGKKPELSDVQLQSMFQARARGIRLVVTEDADGSECSTTEHELPASGLQLAMQRVFRDSGAKVPLATPSGTSSSNPDKTAQSSAPPLAPTLRPLGTTASLPLPFPGHDFANVQRVDQPQLLDDDKDDEPASSHAPASFHLNHNQKTGLHSRPHFHANSDANSSSSSSSSSHSRPVNPNPDSARNNNNHRHSIDSSTTAVSHPHSHGSGPPCIGCTVEYLSSRLEQLGEREVERNVERLEVGVMRLEGREMRAEVLREMGEIRKRMKWHGRAGS